MPSARKHSHAALVTDLIIGVRTQWRRPSWGCDARVSTNNRLYQQVALCRIWPRPQAGAATWLWRRLPDGGLPGLYLTISSPPIEGMARDNRGLAQSRPETKLSADERDPPDSHINEDRSHVVGRTLKFQGVLKFYRHEKRANETSSSP
jgi:hypothetical protein